MLGKISLLLFLCSFVTLSWRSSNAQSILGTWQFEATATDPSASMHGSLDVLFDSASYVLGAIRVDEKVERFHGRHFGSRFIARTDTTAKPVMRLDAMIDSTGSVYNGNLQVGGIEAKEAGKKPKMYDSVLFAFFASKVEATPAHKPKKKRKR